MNASEKSPRTIRVQTALLLVGMFAAGVVTGAGVLRLAMGPPPPRHHHDGPHHLGPFAELGLSKDQEAKVKAVMEAHRPEIDAVFQETFPKVRAVHEAIEKEARAFLSPEQQQKLDALKAQRPAPLPGRPRPPFGHKMGPPHPDADFFPGPPPPPEGPRE